MILSLFSLYTIFSQKLFNGVRTILIPKILTHSKYSPQKLASEKSTQTYQINYRQAQ